jgi:hypothetical protein
VAKQRKQRCSFQSCGRLPTQGRPIATDFRDATDVTKGAMAGAAIGLGAKGTMVGRAFLYGLGAMGEAGVRLIVPQPKG